jgi:ATP-binding cassette, subfamily C (CFTR/MRP), member 1
MVEKFQTSFKKRVARGDKRPLLGALYETFKMEFLLGGFFQLTSSLLQSLSPFVLRYLINFSVEAYIAQHTGRKPPSLGRGIGLVVGIHVSRYDGRWPIQSCLNNGNIRQSHEALW